MTEAAKTAHAHNFILKLPQGYETVIGEHGERLDAGQGFRLGLARAILRNPSLLIIEEPTDSLDDDTKSLMDDSYNRIVRGRTVIFLPNRLSTLRRSEKVVFLHRGKVEAQGSYHELVKNSTLFRHWEYMHFNQFRRELQPVHLVEYDVDREAVRPRSPPSRRPASAVFRHANRRFEFLAGFVVAGFESRG